MPLTDKELALRYLAFAEDLILQSSAYQLLLNRHVPNWQDEFQAILDRCGEQTKQAIHERLEATWTQTFEAPDLSTVVEQMIEGIQRNDPK
jgi:hypothetical protein